MISDDERRFVCENLRQCAENPQFPEYMEQFMFDLCIILFGLSKEKHRHSEIFSRLADFVEPSCDRDALLALAEESDNQAEFVLSHEWEPSHQIMAYALANECLANARRIREALGVE